MTNREFLDITEGFDNVRHLNTPTFLHMWINDDNKIESRPGELTTRSFKGDVRQGILEYLEEYSKGRTVYFYGEPRVMYDPHNFEPILMLRTNSYKGVLKVNKEEQKIEAKVESFDNNKFKYLLIR